MNKPSEPDRLYMFAKALGGTATLLIGAWSLRGTSPAWVMAAGSSLIPFLSLWKCGTSYACSNNLSFTADSTGYWFIRVHIYDDTLGFYNLHVSVVYTIRIIGGEEVAQSSTSGTVTNTYVKGYLTYITQTA